MPQPKLGIQQFLEEPLPASIAQDEELVGWAEVFRDMINGRIKMYAGCPVTNRTVAHCAMSMAMGSWSGLSPERKQEYKDYARKRLTEAASQAVAAG